MKNKITPDPSRKKVIFGALVVVMTVVGVHFTLRRETTPAANSPTFTAHALSPARTEARPPAVPPSRVGTTGAVSAATASTTAQVNNAEADAESAPLSRRQFGTMRGRENTKEPADFSGWTKAYVEATTDDQRQAVAGKGLHLAPDKTGSPVTAPTASTRRNEVAAFVGTTPIPLPESVDLPSVPWTTTAGTGSWIGQKLVTHDGLDAGASGKISVGGESWMETTFTGPGTLGFWWKASGATNNELHVGVDGTDAGVISGEVNWQQRTLSIGSGTHKIRWRYSKNANGSPRLDLAWVDQVTFTPGSPQPVIPVDGRSTGSNPDGSLSKPYRTMAQGHAAVVVNKPVILEPYDGPVLLGGSISGGLVPNVARSPSPSPAPMLAAPTVQSNGTFALPFTGVAGQRYQVLTTTNMVTWQVWKDFVAEMDTFDIIDENAVSTPQRFFKVIKP